MDRKLKRTSQFVDRQRASSQEISVSHFETDTEKERKDKKLKIILGSKTHKHVVMKL